MSPYTGFEVEAYSGREPSYARREPAAEIPRVSEGTLDWRKRVRVERTGDRIPAARRF
jgi:hypothetical protein